MKIKEKLIIVILLSLSRSAILTNVLGQTTYTCKVKVGDEFIFTLTTLTAAYGETRKRVGDKFKILITDITEETDYFEIEYDIWFDISKGESFSSTADYHDWEDIYKDPTNLEADWLGNRFILTPVSDYLTAFAETASYYSSSGNKLTLSNFDSREWISTFDSKGVVSKIVFKKNGTVASVLSRGGGSSIPGYNLPILIGLTAIAGVSIIYIVKKKKLK